jgi:hypothetical protein
MADAVDATLERRIGQEGSRWYNAPPTGAELAKWFEENVPLHDGLVPKPYVPGVTMIPATEKAKTVTGWQGNTPIIQQIENLVFVPYAKVETRVKYFHDLMAKHDDWLGVIEPVATEKQVATLPKGFFRFQVQTDKGVVNYVCCTMKVTVFDRESVTVKERLNPKTGELERWRDGKTIIDSAPATKMIATLDRWGADDYSLMKAETGAVGRALGMAGMLVIPGTGIATAEDMQEASAAEGRSTPALPEETGEAAQAPPVTTQEAADREALTDARQEAVLLLNTIKEEFPPLFEGFLEWAKERKIGEVGKLDDLRILRGIVTKAERELAEAREKRAADAKAEAPTVETPAADADQG